MTSKGQDIASVIKQQIEQFSMSVTMVDVGTVIEVGDGIARVYGLSNAMAGELVEFETSEGSVMGQVMNLETDTVGAVPLAMVAVSQDGVLLGASAQELLNVGVGDEVSLTRTDGAASMTAPGSTTTTSMPNA